MHGSISVCSASQSTQRTAEDEGLRATRTCRRRSYVFRASDLRREEWVDGRRRDCGSSAIIHRQANQAGKSGTMEPSKSRVGIKAALTGHCNPIEMFTLHLCKGNGCGEWEVRRKDCPLVFDVELWKDGERKGEREKKRPRQARPSQVIDCRSFIMSLGYFDFEFTKTNFFPLPFFPSFEPSNGNIMMIYEMPCYGPRACEAGSRQTIS